MTVRVFGRSSSLPGFPDPKKTDTKKPRSRPATELAQELQEVLQGAHLKPPYVLVAHSYAGVIVCEYSDSHPQNIAGLVFIDANSSRSADRPLGDADFQALFQELQGSFDYWHIVGLNSSHKLTEDEWAELKGEQGPPEGWTKSKNGESAEKQHYVESCRSLGTRKQIQRPALAGKPISVIHGHTEEDMRRVIDEIERLGGGTPEERARFGRGLNDWTEMDHNMQSDVLELTSQGMGRTVVASKSGHYVQLTEPEVVVEEIQWVLQQLKTR